MLMTQEQIETRKKWIQKLRSEEYAQGTKYLRRDSRFCCLGVLCDMLEPEGWKEGAGMRYEHRGYVSFPSPFLLDKVGITEEQAKTLAEKNDLGFNFNEIAGDLESWITC